MKSFEQLIDIIDRLLGPGGCPWDQAQTLLTLRSSVLEEACELIEAIDLGDNIHIKEELGDLLFNALFFCKVAEKEKRLTLSDVVDELKDKLIRRHPHVFGEADIKTTDEVMHQWEEIKKKEAGKGHRTSALDSIPKGLPGLARAQKVIKKAAKEGCILALLKNQKEHHHSTFQNEEDLGELLFQIVNGAEKLGLDAESALKSATHRLESLFRKIELEEKNES